MKKIKEKVLMKKDIWLNAMEESIKVEINERTCPICDKKWISVYINGFVVYGGKSITVKKGEIIESCLECDLNDFLPF